MVVQTVAKAGKVLYKVFINEYVCGDKVYVPAVILQ